MGETIGGDRMEIDENLYKALCTGRIYVQKDSMGKVVRTNAVDPIFYDVKNRDMSIFYLNGRYYKKMDLPFPSIDLYEDVSEQVIDKVTGCYKKEALCAYVSSHQDTPPFLLAVCDIDNFKYVNDTYGHHYGDVVIERMGSIFRSMVGDGLACRWGGDEFVLVVSEENQNKLEEIRMAVASEILPFGYSVTITIGATRYEPGENVEDAIKRADISLYKGKDRGRNIAITDYAERRNKVLSIGKKVIPRTRTSHKAQNE